MRVKGIDGLRALSALAVFSFHGNGAITGGWLGVDVFFVISGFVITRSLKLEYEQSGKILLGQFYLRRLLRLWPALLAMVAVLCLLHPVPVREWLPTITYTSNITRIIGDYPSLFAHTWSLAVEEQFYLIWPLMLLLILKSQRPVLWLVIGVVLAASWRLHLEQTESVYRVLNSLDTRADGLMLGALLAFIDPKHFARFWPFGILGLVWMLAAHYNDPWVMAFGLPLIALCAATLIAKVTHDQEGWITRFLELKPLSGLGRISYAFYVWHYPILYFYYPKYGFFLCLIATTLFAWASWILIERPIRQNRDRLSGDNQPPNELGRDRRAVART